MKNNVVTRVAPSPTGTLHVGTALVGLFNFLHAKQNDGTFVLRIEDTDKERCSDEFEKDILESFSWLGLTYDALVKQSEQAAVHTEKISELLKNDTAYISKEEAKDGSGRVVEVVRLRNPGTVLTFTDTVRGDITFDTTELGDFVIARSVSDPLYHLAVVIDDAQSGVTHVIRGEDHISNTPRQILIGEALGYDRPIYTHIPLLLAKDRSKLSKRKGAVSVTEYRKMGFYPEAVLNQLALLGWNPGTEKEIFTLNDLLEEFSLSKIQKSGAIFDVEKMKWIQKEHRKFHPNEAVQKEFLDAINDYKEIQNVLKTSERAFADVLERFALTSDFRIAIQEGEFDFYLKRPDVEQGNLAWKKDAHPEKNGERLQSIIELLEGIDVKTFTYENVKSAVWEYAEQEGKGDVLWPMRYALSGRERSPDPFLLAEALGKEETLERLTYAKSLYT